MEWMLAEAPANFLFHRHHGFHVEWSLNDQFHMEWGHIHLGFHGKSRWIPWNNSIWIPLKFHMENTMIFVVKNSVKYENWTLNSTTHHVHEWENTLTAAPSNHWKTIKWPQYILCTMATTQIEHWQMPMLDLGVNKQQPPSSSTTTTTHNAHPQCPPIITTPPPTTNNHLDTLVHHTNDAGMPCQQPQLTTTMTDHNHNHNRQWPCHNNGRMTPCDEMMTWPRQHTTQEWHQWRQAPNTTPLPTTAMWQPNTKTSHSRPPPPPPPCNNCPCTKMTAHIWKWCTHRQQWPPRYENETKWWMAFVVRHWF